MKTNKIVFWVSTGLLSVMLVMGAMMYFFTYDDVSIVFGMLGFPTWIIYPLAVAKLLAVVAILTRLNRSLYEWAYAALFFELLLAVGAHVSINDGEFAPAIGALVMLIVSYIFQKRAFPQAT